MARLSGKVAIITGAGSGMGVSEALLFAEEGAKVIITDVNEASVQAVAEQIKAKGGQVLAMKQDVSDEAGWQAVVDAGIAAFGEIDILVNNAGILSMKPLLDTTTEEFEKIMQINNTGVFFGMKAVIPSMQKKGAGSIVNISSLAALYGVGSPGYNASKGAVRSMTKNVALTYGADNIRVNTIHPGLIMTPMVEAMMVSDEAKAQSLAGQALKYFGRPEDVAQSALFLASDESRFITGAELLIDGGSLTM